MIIYEWLSGSAEIFDLKRKLAFLFETVWIYPSNVTSNGEFPILKYVSLTKLYNFNKMFWFYYLNFDNEKLIILLRWIYDLLM